MKFSACRNIENPTNVILREKCCKRLHKACKSSLKLNIYVCIFVNVCTSYI